MLECRKKKKRRKIKSLNLYRNAVGDRAAVTLQELFTSHLEKFKPRRAYGNH